MKNKPATTIKTDLDPVITSNDQALARYKAIESIMRAMRMGALTTMAANEACKNILVTELLAPFIIRGSFDRMAGTLSHYGSKIEWSVGTHVDTGLAYAWRKGNPEPTEADGLTNLDPDNLGEVSCFINIVTVTR